MPPLLRARGFALRVDHFKVTTRAVTLQVDHEGRVTAEVRNATIEEGLG